MRQYLPGADLEDEQAMGVALYLDKRHWEQMEIAVANGITRAFKG